MDNKTSKFSITLDNIFRIIFFIISITGCIFQICKIWDNYFSYETNTYVIYEEEKIQLPEVTVCMRKSLLIREELLHHFSRRELENRYSSLEDSEMASYLNNFTVKE
jgi:hypothetical protein